MLGGRLSAGVEIGAGQVRVALVHPGPVPKVMKVAEEPLLPGEELRAGAVAARLLTKLGSKNADVHLAFAPARTADARHQLFVAPKKLRAAELNSIALRELKKDQTLSPQSALFAVERVGESEGEGGGGDLNLLVALARAEVEPAAGGLLDARQVVRSATSATMALVKAAQVANVPANGVVALAVFERRRSSLVVLDHGVPRFFRDLPGISQSGSAPVDDDRLAEALARELDLSLVYFAQQNRPKTVESVMVMGEPAFADRVADWLSESPKYEVARFEPSAKLAVDPSITESLSPYAAAIGAALPSKGRAIPDVLPTELKGRPERAIAFVIGGVVLLAFVALLLQVRKTHVATLDRETARMEQAQAEFDALSRKVADAGRIDAQATHAQTWQELFDDEKSYHRRLAKLLFQLPAALPAHTKLLALTLADAPPPQLQPGQAPPAPGTFPNLQLHLEGTVAAGDMVSAQGELRELVEAAEKLPTVKSATLQPIKSPTGDAGVLEIPFVLDLAVMDSFPGGKR